MSAPSFGQKISGNRKPEFQAVILAGYGTACVTTFALSDEKTRSERDDVDYNL